MKITTMTTKLKTKRVCTCGVTHLYVRAKAMLHGPEADEMDRMQAGHYFECEGCGTTMVELQYPGLIEQLKAQQASRTAVAS